MMAILRRTEFEKCQAALLALLRGAGQFLPVGGKGRLKAPPDQWAAAVKNASIGAEGGAEQLRPLLATVQGKIAELQPDASEAAAMAAPERRDIVATMRRQEGQKKARAVERLGDIKAQLHRLVELLEEAER
jgi:hypothetical protein